MVIDPLEQEWRRAPNRRRVRHGCVGRRDPVERGFSFQDERSWMSQSTGACRAESIGPDWSSLRRGMRLVMTRPCNDASSVVR